ncbi:MAG: cadmium-translocating P-type ATPase [Sulfuricellaceae bacterium]|nr:cadmium-translocating P-type ATPase [Sulfuricellaceae bacterium]
MANSVPECYHCGLPVPASAEFPVKIEGISHGMCCRGCQAVAQAIVENGLQAYYRHRTALPKSALGLIPDELQKLDVYNHPGIQQSFVIAPSEHLRQATLILEGITCAACVWLNERHLQQLPGVKEVLVNYSNHRARITWDERETQLSHILREIQLLGYRAHPYNAQQQEDLRKKERSADLRRIAVASLSAMQVMSLAVALYGGEYSGIEHGMAMLMRYVSLIMTLPVILYAALPFYKSAWRALSSRRMNMDVPVTLAIASAFGASTWSTLRGEGAIYFDAVTMFSLFLLTTRFLERGARAKSTEAVENLLKLAPVMATRVIDGQHQVVAVLELVQNDIVLVKPGETIAADGVVVEGESSTDESLLTGESRPVSKEIGAAVIAGSMNLEGPLFVKVTGIGENTVLAGIVRLLDRAQAEKPRIAQMADRVAAHFTYGLLLTTAIISFAWWWIDPSRAFGIAISVLVVTCPCALSLAAPAAFAAAGSRLLKRGVLLTRGHALETLAQVTQVVFDKTGTLTYGKPLLQKTMVLGDLPEARCLAIAASLEQASEHPLAASFLAAVDRTELLAVEQAQNMPGKGVSGSIDGQRYFLGNRHLLANADSSLMLAAAERGASVVWLGDDSRLLAAFVLSDELRPEALDAIAQLKQAGLGVMILSGDGQAAVRYAAERLGVKDYCWEQRPEDKLQRLHDMQRQGAVVAMVGDGLNDAPILAGSQVSLAMGSGTEVAHASSDIILLSQNLSDVWHALETGRASISVMRQNFAWAIGYNLLAVPFAALGYVPPWLAALGMSVSSLVVVANALRLRQA